MKEISKKLVILLLFAIFIVSVLFILPISAENIENSDNHYKYYYNQLSNQSKKIYDAMVEMYTSGDLKNGDTNYDLVANGKISTEAIKKYKQGDKTLLEDFENARDAFYLDYPDLFYINIEKYSLRITSDSNGYHVWLGTGNNSNYYLTGFTSKSSIDTAEEKYKSALNKIVDGANALSSKYTGEELLVKQIEYVHDEVAKSTVYKLDDKCKAENIGHIRTPYGALVAKEAVCEGYAKTFKLALDNLNIPCVLVRGVYKEGNSRYERHMWNYVCLSGKWYAVDVTFDDSEKTNNTGAVEINKDYFLFGESHLSIGHNPEGIMSNPNFEFTYPELEYATYGEKEIVNSNGLNITYKVVPYDGNTYVELGISYKGMNFKEAKKAGYHFVTKYYTNVNEPATSNWSYIDTVLFPSMVTEKDGYFTMPLYSVPYIEVAVTDVAINSKAYDKTVEALKYQYLQGDESMFLADSGIIGLPDATYVTPPKATSATPYVDSKLKAGKATHIKVSYNENLVKTDPNAKPSCYITTKNAWTSFATMNSTITNFKWDGAKTIEFDFTPSSSWGDNSVIYYINVSGLVGETSKKIPDPVHYYVQNSFGCTYSMAQSKAWNVYGRPTLIDDGTTSVEGWKLSDGTIISKSDASKLNGITDRLALVVEKPSTEQTEKMNTLVENKTTDRILKSETYNINLILCNKKVLSTANGHKVTVYLGFPEGYGPDDAGVTFKAYHFKTQNGGITEAEEIPCVITPYGLLVTCNAFSPFEVVAVENSATATKKSVVFTTDLNGGIKDLSNNIVTLNSGEIKKYTVKANSGYQIDTLTVFGKEIKAAQNKETYEITLKYDTISDVNNIVDATFVAKTIAEEEEQRGETTVVQLDSATPTFEMTLETEKDTYKAGEIIEVKGYIKNQKNIKDGIIAISGQFKIDTSVVEFLSENTITGENGWNLSAFNSDNFKFVTDNGKLIKEDSPVFTLHLKVKENLKSEKQLKIRVNDVNASGGNGVILPIIDPEKTVSLVLKEKIESTEYDIENEEFLITNVEDNTKVSSFRSKVTANRTLEFVGIDNNVLSDTDLIVTGAKVKVGDIEYIIVVKGDIDSDGKITVGDLAKLKLHLIDEQILTGIFLKASDVDGNDNTTVNDLAFMKLKIISEEKKNLIKVSDTTFNGYEFNQITPVDKKATFSRVIMTSKDMEPYGSTGAGSQWPTSLETSKDGSLMLTGNDVAGMAKSTDHGKTWKPTNSGFQSRGVGMFAIDPYNTDHCLALGISRWIGNGGIYYSFNQAETWDKQFRFACNGARYLWDGLEFDPTTYSQELGYTTDVYFSTPYKRDTYLRSSSQEEPDSNNEVKPEEAGLYKSTDGGKTFNLIINDARLADSIIRITDNGDVYLGSQYGLFLINKTTNTIDKSYLLNDPEVDYTKGVTGLDVVGNTIYAQTWDGIYELKNGELRKITTDTYTSSNWAQFLEVSESNPNHMIYMYREKVDNPYSIGVKVSNDYGQTWEEAKFTVNSAFYKQNGRGREKVFIIDPSNDNVVITFAGDNLERSTDGGLTFAQVAGLSNTMQGGRFNFNFYNPDLTMFSAQDYTGAITKDGGKYYSPLKIDGKGNIYGGFAADENTYFGFANETWWGGTLTVTYDGGKSWKDFGLEAVGGSNTPYYSSMQSYSDPNVLFAAQYYSKDKGKTWQEMNGCISVFTINYTGQHEIYGGDKDGNLVVSYDNGDTWTKLNYEPFYSSATVKALTIIDIAYDHVNNIAYVLLNLTKEGGNEAYVYKYDITNKTSKRLIYPMDRKRGWGTTKSIAIDPNSVNVIYIGYSGNYYCSATGLIRSIDGGETWRVLTTANDPNYEAYATNQGGYEVATVRVNPYNGKAWISCGCYGYETIDPPYDSSLINNNKVEHTIKYVYNGEVVKEVKVSNGKPHNYVYEKDGVKFIDWYTDADFENSFSNGNNVYKSMVLYAKTEASKKLELYVSNELFKAIDLDKYDGGSKEFIPEKDGYAFAGWFKDEELTEVAEFDKINSNARLYAGWYKVEKQIFNPEQDDMAVYIAFSDHKIQGVKMVDNSDYYINRSIHQEIEKNSSYLITFKMDTRFRTGLAKSQFWPYGTVSEYYINENDNNGVTPYNNYVYKTFDSASYTKLLIFYYTGSGSANSFMDVKNTFSIYKLESKNLIYNCT